MTVTVMRPNKPSRYRMGNDGRTVLIEDEEPAAAEPVIPSTEELGSMEKLLAVVADPAAAKKRLAEISDLTAKARDTIRAGDQGVRRGVAISSATPARRQVAAAEPPIVFVLKVRGRPAMSRAIESVQIERDVERLRSTIRRRCRRQAYRHNLRPGGPLHARAAGVGRV